MNKQTIILIGLILLCSLGCKKETTNRAEVDSDTFKPSGGLTDLVYNPVRPDGTIDSTHLPILTWEEDIYDFGTAYEGDIVTRDYIFTNTGTAPLLILQATSSCGCTVPEWPKIPVPPDSSASIKVKFNTLHKPGAQSKEVTIFANTFPNQSRITIKGIVETKN